jgi:hypothetical protein
MVFAAPALLTQCTVAQLTGALAASQWSGGMVYLTDCLWSGGTGCYAISNGTNWIDPDGRIASTSAYAGPALAIEDEGSVVLARATAINFIGAGVTASASGTEVDVNIPGGGSGGTPNLGLSLAVINGMRFF